VAATPDAGSESFFDMDYGERREDFRRRMGDRRCAQCSSLVANGTPCSFDTDFCCDACEQKYNVELHGEDDLGQG
jgi:hypothetical protein